MIAVQHDVVEPQRRDEARLLGDGKQRVLSDGKIGDNSAARAAPLMSAALQPRRAARSTIAGAQCVVNVGSMFAAALPYDMYACVRAVGRRGGDALSRRAAR